MPWLAFFGLVWTTAPDGIASVIMRGHGGRSHGAPLCAPCQSDIDLLRGTLPHFSVVIPAFNAEATIVETLEAVLAQSSADWECVVVDDGSTDGTRALAESFGRCDSRFTVVSQPNAGTAGAYNTGVARAAGDFIVLCSADDLLLPEHLAVMGDFIQANSDYSIFSSNGYYLHPDGSRELVYSKGELPDSMTLADVMRNCFFSVGAVYRRGLFDRVGGYRPEVFGEDYDFWLRAIATGAKHRYLDQPLSLHRLSAHQKSANLERAFESDIRLLEDLRTTHRLSPEELAVLDETVDLRRKRIGELRGDPAAHTQSGMAGRVAVRVLGARRARKLASMARSLFARR